VFFGFGPGAELLAVVAEDRDRAGVLFRHLGQILDRLLRRAEGDQVAEPLAAWEHRKHAAFVLGQQMAGQLIVGQPGRFEVEVVQHGVFDAGVNQVAGERLLPNALGRPEAADRRAQPVLQPTGVAANLTNPILRRNHRQDRLEIRAAENLDPPGLAQTGQTVEIVRLVFGQPFHQRAARVQRHFQRVVAAENIEKRQIAVLIGLLEDVVEISDRLVVVQGQNQTDGIGHGGWRQQGLDQGCGRE